MFKKVLVALVLAFVVVASVAAVPQVAGGCESTGDDPCS